MKILFPLRKVLMLFLVIYTTQSLYAQNSDFKNYEGTWISEPYNNPFVSTELNTATMTNTISNDGKSLVINMNVLGDNAAITLTDNGNGKVTFTENIYGDANSKIVKINSSGTGSEFKFMLINGDLENEKLDLRYSSADNTITLLVEISDSAGQDYDPASVIITMPPGVTIEQRLNGRYTSGAKGEKFEQCSWWQMVKFKKSDAGNTPIAVNNSNLSAEQKEVIDAHNFYRAEVKSDPIIWSNELAAFAQAWADHLAQTDCQLQHRPSDGQWKQQFGENIYMGSSLSLKAAVDAFGSEKSQYNGEALSGDNWYASGHYTQMIWNKTTKVGCGYAKCSNGNYIVVFNYDPPGNYMGETPYKK